MLLKTRSTALISAVLYPFVWNTCANYLYIPVYEINIDYKNLNYGYLKSTLITNILIVEQYLKLIY